MSDFQPSDRREDGSPRFPDQPGLVDLREHLSIWNSCSSVQANEAGRTKIAPRASRDRLATSPIAYRLMSGYFTHVWLVEIKSWKDHVMKLSARNQLKGTIVDVVKGATTSHVRVDIGGGVIVTASITNEAVDELKLAKGKSAVAVIKASDVMVGVD